MQHLRDWREGPIDCMALAMNCLQGYYKLELARGKQGLGNYHLHPIFSNIADGQILIPSDHVYQPEEIVKRLKRISTEMIHCNLSCSRQMHRFRQCAIF